MMLNDIFLAYRVYTQYPSIILPLLKAPRSLTLSCLDSFCKQFYDFSSHPFDILWNNN